VALDSVTFTPIGVVRSPWLEPAQAPRQAAAAEGVQATIELAPGRGLEDALSDLEGWEFLWVIFWFHRVRGWRPKVLPPRSRTRRGVLSTRAPHRPNAIGLSLVRLDKVEGLVLRIRDVDILDGTPVLDLKPYVPYADARPDARTGWLGPLVPAGTARAKTPADPEPGFSVVWSDRGRAQAAWLRERRGDLAERVEAALALGPQPHAYRRIKRVGDALVLSVKDWRVRFRVDGRVVMVEDVSSGYREQQLDGSASAPAGAPLALHRAFVARFGR
jgi:tRNA (adenine37-N6)-methyltransferase